MLKSYYCLSYNFKTKDDGRIIHLRLLLHTEHKNVHKCNSRLIIAISEAYDFIEYTMDYLSNAHLDKCSAEDKITRYGYQYAVQSNPIKIDLHHYSIDNKTNHIYFNYIEDTFNTLEEQEILSVKSNPRIEALKAVEIKGKYTVARLDFPPIRLYNAAK